MSDFTKKKDLPCFVGYAFIGAIAIWLMSSATIIQIEPDDGLATIVNSKYLVGLTESHFFNQRGPVFALLLAPAAWLSNALNLAPLDMRLYHGTFAILTVLYLCIIWNQIQILFPDKGLTPLVTFTSSITTFVFFSYSPFISHDIFPGLLLIWMLLLVHKYCEHPNFRTLSLLILIGAIAPLIKQTYALFWGTLIISRFILTLTLPKERRRQQARLMGHLLLAACLSAIITWIGYCLSLSTSFENTSFLLRPIKQIQLVSGHYAGENLAELFPWWIYPVNLHAYGILTMALILPGLYFSLSRGNQLQKHAALLWLSSFIAISSVAFREVRYLAFLAPVSAIVIYPVVRHILGLKKIWVGVVIAILAVDLLRSMKEAGAVYSDFYENDFSRFFSLIGNQQFSGNVFLSPMAIARIFPLYSPLIADRYHRVFNLNAVHLQGIFHKEINHYQSIPIAHQINLSIDNFKPGDIYIFANGFGVRRPPWSPGNQVNWSVHNHIQGVALAKPITLTKEENNYLVDNSVGDKNRMFLFMRTNQGTYERSPLSNTLAVQKAEKLYGLNHWPDKIETLALEIDIICSKYLCEHR